MAPKFKTKDLAKSFYANYLKKSEECLHAAKNSFANNEWNASAINAIHSCISDECQLLFPSDDNYFSLWLK